MKAPEATRRVEVHHDPADFAIVAAAEVARAAREAVKVRGRFMLALSGGTTPRPAFERLGLLDEKAMPWGRTHVFWSDERCVPPGHGSSNYAMAREAMLDRAPVPEAQVHRVPGEVAPPEAAARLYEKSLHEGFGIPEGGALPRFDLVLLGVGEDGHTASLFPGSPALQERERWAVAVPAPGRGSPTVPRVTLTLPVLCAAREACFLVAGEGKRAIVPRVFAELDDPRPTLPAAMVRPQAAALWLLDAAAAQDLPTEAH